MDSDLLQSVVPALYRTFARQLVKLLDETRRVPDQATAEDVVQDCFAVLTEHPELLAPVRNHEAWLTIMVLHRAEDHRRSSRRTGMPPLEPGDDVESPEHKDPSPDETLAPFGQALKSAMGKLTPRQSDVVSLHVLQNFSLSEVATLLGLTKSTVSQHYQAAIRNLQQELEGVSYGNCGRGTR